jgi:hypothetical protein
MIFLLEYDRKMARLVSLRSFAESERRQAEDARLTLELSLKRDAIEREVVILEAADIAGLQATHRRYFEFLLPTITLDEFMRRSQITLRAFEHAVRLRHAEDPANDPLERDEHDWWREVAAYVAYTEAEDQLLPRASGGSKRK